MSERDSICAVKEKPRLKQCLGCHQEKAAFEFYNDPDSKDGLVSRCKECYRISRALYRKRNPRKLRESYQRWYASRSQEAKQAKKDRYRGRYRDHTIAYQRQYRANNKDKIRAHDLLRKAVKRGRVTKPGRCELCQLQTPSLHAHHDDYTKPLDVKWLCRRCHSKQHPQAIDAALTPQAEKST